MEFMIRKNSKYLDVAVVSGGTIIELGLLDDTERADLAKTLKDAADELMEGIDPNP